MGLILKGLFVFSFPILAIAMPYDDKEFGCTSEQKARQFLSDFSIDEGSFGGLELCDSNVETKKLFNDLTLVEQGQFAGSDSNVFILNQVDRNNYYPWLKEQTRGVRRGNDMPTATAYNSGGYFTMQDGWAKLSTLGRVGTIVHEARHTEGYRHYYCDHGPYEGISSLGCDRTVQEGGAHGIEMEYYSRVALQGQNFHPVYQSMARLMTTARSNFEFNQDPMGKSEGLVALSGSQLVTILNGQTNQLKLSEAVPSGALLKRTSFGLSILTPEHSVHAIDLKVAQPEVSIEDQYSYFKLTTIRPISNVVDMEEIDIQTKRYFVAVDQKGFLYNYNYGEGDWNPPVPSAGVVRFANRSPNGVHGLFGIFESGQYCQLNPETMRCSGANATWPTDIDQVVMYESQQLNLNNGVLYDAKTLKPFAPLKNFAVEQLVETPFYNVF